MASDVFPLPEPRGRVADTLLKVARYRSVLLESQKLTYTILLGFTKFKPVTLGIFKAQIPRIASFDQPSAIALYVCLNLFQVIYLNN